MRCTWIFLFLIVSVSILGCTQHPSWTTPSSSNSLLYNPSREFEERVKHDDFTGETRYQYYPGRGMFETRFRATYIKTKNNKKTLLSEIYYFGNNWLFVVDLLLKIDDADPISLPVGQFSRTVLAGNMISETAFGVIDIKMLKKIANSDVATLRFVGKKGNKDYKISATEKQGLLWVLSEYEK